MPIGSQVWGWPAAGFDQSSLKALLQLFLSDLAFSVGQAFFHFFILSDFKLLKQRSRKKKENITKLLNQSLVVFLVILHSLVSPAPQHTHTHTPLSGYYDPITTGSTGMLLHCPTSAHDPSIFPRENEGMKHLSKFEFLFPLSWHLY